MKTRTTVNARIAASRSIIVLEAPWSLHEQDQLRVSVLPFIQGMAQVCGDIDVLYSRFFDKSSFDQALTHLTSGPKYENTVVYIAGHGEGRKIEGVDIRHLMLQVGLLSKSKNISGILLGSCLVGNNTTTMETYLIETSLRWMAGYRCIVDWMSGTMIDISILQTMLSPSFDTACEEIELYREYFSQATNLFDKEALIGVYESGKEADMADSLVFSIQPSGRGRRPISFRCGEL
ncbi:hypothetical protein [Aquitalea magnusonii]|uniref:CHAT domain-containing protein n=1 Tax=Aquitalea magnusonii TaxID=332411 RepID=A0A318JQN8_9NEIS|nr:hypothetical protein [Aquitalea magnusonii]PXX51103.1 hypothetical protein DFR38_101164 [Aquitalea magnusonii]